MGIVLDWNFCSSFRRFVPLLLTSPFWTDSVTEFPVIPLRMKIPRHHLAQCLILGVCVSLTCLHSARAAQEKMSEDIQQIMTPGEFKAAGLSKLTPDELAKLNAWLQGYRQVTEQAAEKKATARASRTKMDVLVSRVDGTFNGLTGRTIIRLEDGTVWKQANADDRFRAKNPDHPAAVVIHGVFGYKMQLEGSQAFYVDPVRNP
jgi:hypothetical protein